MSENERELIGMICESEDPAKAMVTAIEIICQHISKKTISPANAGSKHTLYTNILGEHV